MSSILISIANIFFICVALCLSLIAKKKIGHYFNPVTIYCFFWFIYLLIPFLLDFNSELNPVAYFYIIVFLSFFHAPIYFYQWRPIFAEVYSRRHVVNFSSFRLYPFFLIGLSFVSISFIYLDLFFQGISFDLNTILYIGGQYAGLRYGEDLIVSRYAQIALVCAYQAALIGGIVCGIGPLNGRNSYFFAISIAPSLFVMLLQSAKGLLFLNLALFFGAYFLMRLILGPSKLPGISWLRGVIGGVLVLVAIILSFISRYDLNAGFQDIVDYLVVSLGSYAAGHMFAFSDWFANLYLGSIPRILYPYESHAFGFYTFMSFFQLFGDDRIVPLGVYGEYPIFDNGLSTNIFTIYRGLLTDFGLAGSLFFAFIMGYFVVFSFRNFLLSGRLLLSAVVIIFFVGFSYQSFVISSLTWLSIPFNFFVFLLFLYIFPPIRVEKAQEVVF